jgi:hypothetical protein
LLKSGVSRIHPIRAMTTMGNHLMSRWRSTSTTKGKTWSVAPLRLKAATSAKLVLIARWRTSSKHTTARLNIPITCTTTKGTKWIITTTPKAETLSTSGRKAPIPQKWDCMHNTLTPRHSTRLRHTTRMVVSVLVCHLPGKPLLPSAPETKLSLMTIPPTMLTMEADWFCFGCWLWFLLMLVAFLTDGEI